MLMREGRNLKQELSELFGKYTVEQYMSTHILVGRVDFKVPHIARLFDEMKIHHLPIIDENRKVVGIITANDMVRIWSSLLEEGKHSLFKSGEIRDFMTKNPVCCTPETTISEAIKLFEQGAFRALPVLLDGELTGIFTANDLIIFLNDFIKE